MVAWVAAATVAVGMSLGFTSVAMADEPGDDSTATATPTPTSTQTKEGRPGPGATATATPTSTSTKTKEGRPGPDGTGAPTGPTVPAPPVGDEDDAEDGEHDDGTPRVKIREVKPKVPDRGGETRVCVFFLKASGFADFKAVDGQIRQLPPTGHEVVEEGRIELNKKGKGRTENFTLPNGHYLLSWRAVPKRDKDVLVESSALTADKDKGDKGKKRPRGHESFWVECASSPSPSPTGGSPSGSPTNPGTTSPPTSSVEPTSPTTTQAAPVPNEDSGTGSLASTGAQAMPMVAAGLALLAVGFAALIATGRMRLFGRRH